MAFGVRLPFRVFAIFACSVLVFISMTGFFPMFESDEQFIERQRLLRRARELRRGRAQRLRRYRMSRSTDPLMPAGGPEQERGAANSGANSSFSRSLAAAVPVASVAPSGAGATETVVQDAPDTTARWRGSAGTTELELHWDDDSSVNKVCRIRLACVQKDGTVLVPGWMREQQEKLEACGLGEVQFMRSMAEWNMSNRHGDTDLFGILPVRYHIPHFVTDLLPALYAMEVLRPTFSDPRTRRVECARADGQACDAARMRDKINTMLLAEDRVSVMNDDAWVPQLMSLLSGQPALVYPRSLFQHASRACFRSVVAFSPHSYVRRGRHWYGPKHALFVRNNISRETVRRAADEKGVCTVQITILNRFGWLRRGGYLVGRDIVNVDDILARLEEAQHGARHRLKLEVTVEYFENTQFKDQVEIMQKADVILGVHGAGLGNLLFAHLDVPFIEVLPFGYYAGPFERLADALHLRYHSIVSEPDTANFYECINSRAKQLGRPEIASRGKAMWRDALGQWKEGDTRVLNSQDFRDPDTTPIKLCARCQRMKLDVSETVKILLQSANSICAGKEE